MPHSTDFELLKAAKAGDASAKNIFIKNNMGLIYKIAGKFMGRGIEWEDLIQLASIGVLKAIDRFNLSFGVEFSTYAVPMIMGEIRRQLRDDGPVKVSRSLKIISIKARAISEEYQRENGTEPNISFIADKLGISCEELAAAMEATKTPHSLFMPANEDSTVMLVDKVTGGENNENSIIDKIILSKLITELDERDRKIIILRYFKEKTQTEISKLLGISQVQVSRIEKKILSKMREKLKA